MSMRTGSGGTPALSRLQAIAAAAITGFTILVTISAIAPDAAEAVTYRPVSEMVFTGSTQLSDCNAWGEAGHNSGKWDFYHCVAGTGSFAGDTVGTGYIITS
jgi:hypothetical protein